ncbi:2Fe-2S iron-sulfur cluster-binding protein [Lewinella sp. JB7]|uniref:2Fe-2S iron-sulfur cluster-binding protein n=1 Tax=Lewinella sp. JB7 TaxID=2962887 RepID=UPI0020C99114|nr:2Fe-2S iron-sulfur cluster-binding protein [Lewinella sp. JB7]MCP9236183.1 2Fe-2S iron-sulfur cluster-binding protein [Lewinella sp. JB7]
MANITFITTDGASTTVSGNSGSVMELARDHNIEGILGNCGGVCSCATCHVHVAPDDMRKTGEASEIERDMLELDDNADEYSRLCCQIVVSDAIDGVVFRVAE